MGLVWATAMVTNLYGAMIVFASLAPEASLTVAQVTVLATMMLVAHTLPVELRIAQKSGPRFRVMVLLRIMGALLIGWILHQIYSLSGYLQVPNVALWNPPPQSHDWLNWSKGEIRNLGTIFIIILVLLLTMKLLEKIKVISLLTLILEPVLKLLGMSRKAAPITIIGMTMGLAFGGGLLIQEARSGRLSKHDIFFSFSFMGICHSVIEDTLLMMIIGGHLSGILWGRIVFSFVVTFIIVKLVSRVSDETFDRFLFRANKKGEL